MATIHVDGKQYEVDGKDNLLQACLALGLDIPYFCWHPALGSVGACRQCAVKQYQDAEDKRGRLVMSCMTPATEGTYIAIDDDEAKAFRASVIEWLMTNHPHDCPVCEEGGHCHLQDMTVMSGHTLRRYRFTKRTHRNQDLGPFIAHEMNRCIACYRCVRYYKDYADGEDLGVFGAHSNLYFGRCEDGTLENEFSGNLVEICPTGVFTDKTHSERYNRKWDMQFAPSICHHCSIGCNISPGERYGELRRIENRYNSAINRYFLCDRGRFGYGYVNVAQRPQQPTQRSAQGEVKFTPEQAIQQLADQLRPTSRIIGIGSPRASLESNFTLRELVGADNFSSGMLTQEQQSVTLLLDTLQRAGIPTPSLREIESYDAILVLGEDITQVAARAALAVRQALKGKARAMAAAHKVEDWQIAAVQTIGQHAKYPLFTTHVMETRLDEVAAWSYHATVDEQARLGFAIAHAIDSTAPVVADFDPALTENRDLIVQALTQAKKPLIISGTHAGSRALIEAAVNIANALKATGAEVGLALFPAEANTLGVGLIGGMSIETALDTLLQGETEAVIILENDLYRRAPKQLVDNALAKVNQVIVLDHQPTATVAKADFVLPAATFAEADGTLINYECRAQRFFQVYDPAHYASNKMMLESWRWLHALHANIERREIDWSQFDQIVDALITQLPLLQKIKDAAPEASFRVRGQKLARSPHRYSGRTAIGARIDVQEPRQPQDRDTMFAFSMEGNNQPQAPRREIPFAWAPGWNSPQSWNKFQVEPGGALRHGDPGVLMFNAMPGQPAWYQPRSVQDKGRVGWQVAPCYRLFGSEELSQCSPKFQQRMAAATLLLNAADANALGVSEGTLMELICLGEVITLRLAIAPTLATGLVGLPLGMPGVPLFLAGARIEQLREAS